MYNSNYFSLPSLTFDIHIYKNSDRYIMPLIKALNKGLLLLLLLSRFSRVRLCATLETAAHQAPPSLGFSRQEHWSGLSFPPPMHESEKLKWSRSVVSDSSRPHGLQPIRLLHPWDFPGKSTGVVCHCLLHKESWALENWCFWIVVLEKTQESLRLQGDQTSQS